ncbi:hypothetical protein ACQPXM_24620 [Kribbella sp. CA-253562]|uniref:hypothetical protein n=1 Tax=Kribbella sp. CA-253562 TaxID=3239942 RepID=UPI003D918BE0
MGRFLIEIRDAVVLGDDFEGDVTLLGFRTGDGDLRVGDALSVPTQSGQDCLTTCVGFPLISMTADRSGWSPVSVSGIRSDEVLVGGLAKGPNASA